MFQTCPRAPLDCYVVWVREEGTYRERERDLAACCHQGQLRRLIICLNRQQSGGEVTQEVAAEVEQVLLIHTSASACTVGPSGSTHCFFHHRHSSESFSSLISTVDPSCRDASLQPESKFSNISKHLPGAAPCGSTCRHSPGPR